MGRTMEELQQALDRAERDACTWRQRVEKAAEALADVAPGELGRMDLVGRGMKESIASLNVRTLELRRERDAARAEVEELKRVRAAAEARLGVVVLERDEAQQALAWRVAKDEHDARVDAENHERFQEACAEVERLKAELKDAWASKRMWKERAEATESRLAAILETRFKCAHGHPVDVVGMFPLEGDAQHEAKDDPPGCARFEHCEDGYHDPACPKSKRYPCSTTCIHEDAAIPGHPERVKGRSEAFDAVATAVEDRDAGLFEEGWSSGAEAMRAACIVAVDVVAAREGLSTAQRASLQEAIMGAVP